MDVVQQLLHANEPGQENQILLTGETVRPVSRLSTVKDKLTNMIWGTAEAFNTDTSNIAEAIPDMENARSKTKDTDTTQYNREKDHSASDYHFPRFGFNQSKPSMPSKLPEHDTASVFNPKDGLACGNREADRERRYVRNDAVNVGLEKQQKASAKPQGRTNRTVSSAFDHSDSDREVFVNWPGGDCSKRRTSGYVSMKPEVSRMSDSDCDSVAPKYATVGEPNQCSSHQSDAISEQIGAMQSVIKDLAEQIHHLSNANSPVSVVPGKDMTPKTPCYRRAALMPVIERQTGSKRQTIVRKLQQSGKQFSDDSTDDESEPRHNYIKPMKFDGTGSFETFYAHFCNGAQHNGWGKKEQLAQLKSCLIKEAGQVLWDSSLDATNTLDKLVELLTNRFGGTRQADKYRMEVRICRRKPTETLSALHQDIRRLMALAHPDIPSSSREVIACDYFIDSLGEPDFALKVRERNPVSLDDALRISLQLEAWARDANRQKDEEGSRMRAKPVRAVTSESSNNAALEARVNMVSQQLNEVLQYLSNPSSGHQVDNSVSQFPMQNGPSTPHWNSNTEPKYPYNPYNKKTKNSNTSSKGCFRCGDPNHYKRECPLNGTPNPAADNARVMNRGSKESKDGRVYLRMKLNDYRLSFRFRLRVNVDAIIGH